MKKINIDIIGKNIKIVAFFIYLLMYYMFGENPEKIKYSEIVLLFFCGLECL